ncbi:hypothetical protein [Nocardioides mesophilus]|uniref:Uncharacterized protein n=1 Tax=Nocardioides mesophilus TaxID=433659 RepID=A0A7G9R821_9ACTN|nr:hypothetical protein [Nocardioides mesophilus]QNN51746.1 hypothetical protein H9L09_14435 [Nocardioides mesophilus]
MIGEVRRRVSSVSGIGEVRELRRRVESLEDAVAEEAVLDELLGRQVDELGAVVVALAERASSRSGPPYDGAPARL